MAFFVAYFSVKVISRPLHLFMGPSHWRWLLRPISRHSKANPIKNAGGHLQSSFLLIFRKEFVFSKERVIYRLSRCINGTHLLVLYFHQGRYIFYACQNELLTLYFFFLPMDEAWLRIILKYLIASFSMYLYEELLHGVFCVVVLLMFTVIFASSQVMHVTTLLPQR